MTVGKCEYITVTNSVAIQFLYSTAFRNASYGLCSVDMKQPSTYLVEQEKKTQLVRNTSLHGK